MGGGGARIDEVALQCSVVDGGADHLDRGAGGDVGIVQREPAVGPQVDVAGGDGLVELCIAHGHWALDGVAELPEQQAVDLRLEPSRVPRSTGQANLGLRFRFLCSYA